MSYRFLYHQSSQEKTAYSKVLDQLSRFSKPTFRPITLTIESILDDESVSEILIELNNRLFNSPNSVFNKINEVFSESFQTARSKNSIDTYREILELAQKLHDLISAPLTSASGNLPNVATSAKKAVTDGGASPAACKGHFNASSD